MQEFQNGQTLIGVEIPEDVFLQSEAEKERKKKSSRRPQVGKDAGNLLYLILCWYAVKENRPKWPRGLHELMMSNCDQLSTAINAANVTKVAEERVACLNTSIALANTIWTETIILEKLGIISEDDRKKVVNLIRRVIAQLVGWRDYSEGVCAASNPNER